MACGTKLYYRDGELRDGTHFELANCLLQWPYPDVGFRGGGGDNNFGMKNIPGYD